ncbi:MAG: hypothetical protein AB1736_01195 [Chloroflexota bacterium]
MTTPAAVPATPEPTHACLRCGRPVAIDVALCDDCNPLGLRQPAATQVHALAAGGIVLFVVFLAVLGRIGLSGVGPFSGVVDTVAAAPGVGLAITLSVSNGGSKAAATTCRVVEAAQPAGGPAQLVQTPIVPAGGAIDFTVSVSAFGDEPKPLAVDCDSP